MNKPAIGKQIWLVITMIILITMISKQLDIKVYQIGWLRNHSPCEVPFGSCGRDGLAHRGAPPGVQDLHGKSLITHIIIYDYI